MFVSFALQLLTHLLKKKAGNENNINLINSSKKKGLINRSISKLSLNNLFNSPDPNKKSTSVLDLRESFFSRSPSIRRSLKLKSHGHDPFRTPIKKDRLTSLRPPSSSSSLHRGKTIVRRHSSKLWSETIDRDALLRIKERFSSKEIKRQEAIFELLQGERDVMDDFDTITNIYHRPMRNLGILKGSDSDTIFVSFEALRPLHHFLVTALNDNQSKDGVFGEVGNTILEWVSGLSVYETFCSNIPRMNRKIEENLRSNVRFADFLERCLESPFSRKLDLKTLLDAPRHRLMKYPLLVQSIKKYTSEDSPDYGYLEDAIRKIEFVVKRVDEKMGEAECKSVVEKLDFDRTYDVYDVILSAKIIHCSGLLKNGRGTKLFCALFDTGFVVARPNSDDTVYLLYRKPIPLRNLCFETKDTYKTSATRSTSAINSSQTFWFRIYSLTNDTSFLLLPMDEHSKKQWQRCLTKYARKPDNFGLSTLPVKSHPLVSPRKRPPGGSSITITSPKRNKSEFLNAIFV